MAALRDMARSEAHILREGIAWLIVYRTGRSWHSMTVWSDIWNDSFEPEDLADALEILKVDPDAVLLNGYYCGHFGEDMTVDELAAGIRWHYEGGHNRLADSADIQAAQQARDSEVLTDLVTQSFPGIDSAVVADIAAKAAALHIDPDYMARILEAFDRVVELVKELAAKLAELLKPLAEAAAAFARHFYDSIVRGFVPAKWIHLSRHAKKARTRKKYLNRIRRHIFATLASEGGGSS